MRLGYAQEAIVERLSGKAAALSMQTLVTNMNYFGKLTVEERADSLSLYDAFETLLHTRMKSCDTQLRGKKVMLRMDDYDLDVSEIITYFVENRNYDIFAINAALFRYGLPTLGD